MCVVHTSLYNHFASIAQKKENSTVCFEPHAGIATKEEKSSVGCEPICGYCKIEGIILCVFWAPMRLLQLKRNLVSVLPMFWGLWMYYGLRH